MKSIELMLVAIVSFGLLSGCQSAGTSHTSDDSQLQSTYPSVHQHNANESAAKMISPLTN